MRGNVATLVWLDGWSLDMSDDVATSDTWRPLIGYCLLNVYGDMEMTWQK